MAEAPSQASAPQPYLYSWGRCDFGQLANGSDSYVAHPSPCSIARDFNVIHASANLFNTACITADGDLFTAGANDSHQLGSKAGEVELALLRVEPLESHAVQHVAVGEGHMLAIVDNGQLASWGGNDQGQTGTGEASSQVSHPRLLRSTKDSHFVRIAAGSSHSLALTGSGQVWACGAGRFGKLGHGSEEDQASITCIERLFPAGIVQVACGENHSAALGLDGRLFTWGRNKYGQLGLGHLDDCHIPNFVRSLSGTAFAQVSCGGDHTVVLSREGGGVWSWGRGTWGQTGHGHTDLVSLPKMVQALAHHCVEQVSAGHNHTLALSSSNQVWSWGSNEMGQAGIPDGPACLLTPACVQQLPPLPILFILAGGDHSLVVMRHAPDCSANAVGPQRQQAGQGLMPTAVPQLCSMAQQAAQPSAPWSQVQALIVAATDMFACPAFIVHAFRHLIRSPTDADHGMDVDAINGVFTSLLKVYSPELVQSLGLTCARMLDSVDQGMHRPGSEQAVASHLDWLRVLYVMLINPVAGETHGTGGQIVQRLARILGQLEPSSRNTIAQWLSELPLEILGARCVRPVQRWLSDVAHRQHPSSTHDREQLLQGISLLSCIYNGNKLAGFKVMPSEFYNAAVCEHVTLREEYMVWRRTKDDRKQAGRLLSICQTPFILTPAAKSHILQGEAFLQKQSHMQASGLQAFFQGIHPMMVSFLDIRVRREAVLEDALAQLVARHDDLKKPLRVTFISAGVDEEAQDEGGVTKEFFQILVHDLFNENYGMFVHKPQTRTFWFNMLAEGMESEFELVGIVIGLAIYNGVILDVHFPLVVYKKLLHQQVTIGDLKQADPEIGQSMQQILDFEGDVESLALSFDVEYDNFGMLETHELKAGGSSIPVTNLNRVEYVDLYVQWHLQQSIDHQFGAFSKGFSQVCGGPALSLFRYEELELLVCGLPHYNFAELEKAARYDGGYDAHHPTIKTFWKLIHQLTLEQKKRFLLFTTGSDRAPVGGLKDLSLIIQRAGGETHRLPTSHTCFNALLLPNYSSESEMKSRLLTAVENAQGFGLQ
ncbi:hypothetical protein WJX74_009408 [Apatococcus lobatus]|uniref:HECT domain-containing protein n=1 Tax=Apatococcus lobatus TaxID=904363 RepID=A0AAW1RDT4_9CHLO